MTLRLTCLVSLLAACAHQTGSARSRYAGAPRITNPMLGPAQVGVPGLSSEREQFVFSGFDGQQLCFDMANTQSPAEAAATDYTLRFLYSDELDLKTAPSIKNGVVHVTASSSSLVPVTRTVQDTVRDAHGNTVATIERQVQDLEPRYETQLRLCFPGAPQVLGPDAHYMVLLRESGGRSGWGFRVAARPSWVWRFSNADAAPASGVTPAVSRM